MTPIDDLDRFEPVSDPRPNDVPWPELDWPIPARTELSGDVVCLTPADPASDAPDLFRQLDHDIVWAHLPFRATTIDEMSQMLAAWSESLDWHAWTVRLQRDHGDLPAGSIVGMTSYLGVNVRDARLEIGATLYTPEVWGTAVNPEAKWLLLRHAFETLQAGRVQLKTDTRNHRSQQAIARLGARYEGALRRHYRRADGTVRDDVMFSIIAEDWPEVNERLISRLHAWK
ncbi:GNAT family N-acetyltransferase [Rhodococcus sp. D2-41]|uniref:GNAT family N-acetyltransferase n=1 Tax=Speluncibacter jeojiensis TaxID=2710754 RepID=UPI00240EC15B|nr:GNAT family protein [Rhodococcus sp. D2-41]MDG3010578.1 GNAT family N-acetyltransferase [Rhodococcus sp. D2-41]